jgi:superfamily II DNA helicase RecQ
MRELGQLVERGVQIVYLTATLPPQQESPIMSMIKTSIEDVYIFRDRTSRANIAYSVVEYPVNEFGGGEIPAVIAIVTQKLEEYPTPAKVIIYGSSVTTV